MDSMVALALVGTARQSQAEILSGTPVDALFTEFPKDEIERRLLLNAGATAIYRQAGVKSHEIADIPEPAAAETLRVCPSSAVPLLSDLLRRSQQQPELLLEALAYMRQRGLGFPYSLLPQALGSTRNDIRAALAPVLGERGHWLSQFNSAWQWVAQQAYLPGQADGLPNDAATIWQEGTLGQRTEILRRVRAVDPAQARTWLEGIWKQEKAEARRTLLSVLESGLSADDEAFLEQALDDRASSVRAEAAALLARLPEAAFASRMQARGTAMLKMVNGQLGVELPAEFGRDWERDGLSEKPPEYLGQRAWWLIQVLGEIPPTFWESHFGMTPAELLQRLPSSPSDVTLVEGWARAAASYRTSDWLLALWNWWHGYYREIYQKQAEKVRSATFEILKGLLKSLPGPRAEAIMLDLLNQREKQPSGEWFELLVQLPRPWSAEFAQAYLNIIREHYSLSALEKNQSVEHLPTDLWLRHLQEIAVAWPVAILAEAAVPWEFPETSAWQMIYIRQRLQEFTETIQLRQRIQKELV
jgi:hypothetical protein